MSYADGVTRDAAVVCVHGHGAMPYEVQPVAEALHAAGFRVEVPRVAGHGIAPARFGMRVFRGTTWSQWVESVRCPVRRLRLDHARVYLYGQSMGGAIALYLGSEQLADGIAVTGAALRLPWYLELLGPLFRVVDVVIREPAPKHPGPFNPRYEGLSSRSGYQLTRLAKAARKWLHRVHCPVLACHSHGDRAIPPKVPALIQARARGPVTVAWFDRSGHLLPLDVEADAVCQRIVAFFTRLEATATSGDA